MNSENPYDAPTEASDASQSDSQSVSYLALISVAWGSAPAFAFAIYAFSQNRRALESLIENNEPINATTAAFFSVAPILLFLVFLVFLTAAIGCLIVYRSRRKDQTR